MHSYCYFGKIDRKDKEEMVMSQISFIHAADLHLDTPFQGLSRIPEMIYSDVPTKKLTIAKM